MKALLRMLCIIGILIIFTVYGIDVTTWQWWGSSVSIDYLYNRVSI